jgi:hypothetical protein
MFFSNSSDVITVSIWLSEFHSNLTSFLYVVFHNFSQYWRNAFSSMFPWISAVSFIPLLIYFLNYLHFRLSLAGNVCVTALILVSWHDQITTLLLGQNTEMVMLYTWGANIFHRCRSHLKIPGTRWVAWSKFHTEDPEILGATMLNLVAQATWHPGFVHSCYMP